MSNTPLSMNISLDLFEPKYYKTITGKREFGAELSCGNCLVYSVLFCFMTTFFFIGFCHLSLYVCNMLIWVCLMVKIQLMILFILILIYKCLVNFLRLHRVTFDYLNPGHVYILGKR